MHSAAPWRSSTANTSSWSHDGSRSSTAQRRRRRRRGDGQELVEPPGVAAPAGRQLHQRRALVRTEPLDPVEVVRQPRAGVAQLHAVRAELAELDGVDEAGRRLRRPPLHGRRRRQPVEGVVDLDGVEAEHGGVVLEPAPRRQLLGVDGAAPVPVVPARAADAGPAGHRVGGTRRHGERVWRASPDLAAVERLQRSPTHGGVLDTLGAHVALLRHRLALVDRDRRRGPVDLVALRPVDALVDHADGRAGPGPPLRRHGLLAGARLRARRGLPRPGGHRAHRPRRRGPRRPASPVVVGALADRGGAGRGGPRRRPRAAGVAPPPPAGRRAVAATATGPGSTAWDSAGRSAPAWRRTS